MPSERVGIFFDGPNLYKGAQREVGTGQLDIPALTLWLANGRTIAEVVYWTAVLNQAVNRAAYAGQRKFFSDLEKRIPNARIGRAAQRRRGNEWVEKGVDVGVALDLVMGAYKDRWDTGILVSGDGDMARAAQLSRAFGKRVEVVYCRNTLSSLLEAEANETLALGAGVGSV